MNNSNADAMIALIPRQKEWCQIELPHVTLVYMGLVEKLSPFILSEVAKCVSSLATISPIFNLKVEGLDVFGEEEKVDVLRLESSPQLLAMRSFLEDWDNGEFPEYKPHATIGPVGGEIKNIPLFLTFDQLLIGWGETEIRYWLQEHKS